MTQSHDFFKSILDTVTEHIVVIDHVGDIVFVNQSWRLFCEQNDCPNDNEWNGVNYLDTCKRSTTMGDQLAQKAAAGIREVMRYEKKLFYLEYPCHSPSEKRWFMMRVTPFSLQHHFFYVISHQNITERKLAEEKMLNLSRLDGLTRIANRRYFDEFLQEEWRRCARLKLPISLAMIDLDHFKLLNDTYGHQAGDDCLRKMGTVLKKIARRPGDLCARYGGEEFAVVLGNTGSESALMLMNELLDDIRGLNIPNRHSPVMPTLTASIGLMTMCPEPKSNENMLIEAADEQLYCAKESGRNRICRSDNVIIQDS
jgi:diguanylate cyclase (GGDEF)-like protein